MLCFGCRYLFTTAGVLSSSAINTAVAARSGCGLLSRTRFRGRPRSSLPAARTFLVTLERAGIEAADDALWKSGVFNAEVHPDLPPAWTIAELLRYYLRRAKEAVLDVSGSRVAGRKRDGDGGAHEAAKTTAGASTPLLGREGEAGGGYLVRTVPVQISRKKELRQRLAAAAGVDSKGAAIEGCRPANALLLVSGSHPGRRLPLMRRFLPDAYDELRLATSMRESGHLPKRLAFWVVANPLLEADEAGVERVRKKVELGAEVIVTQPPLVWESFERRFGDPKHVFQPHLRWLRGVRATGALAEGAALTIIGDDGAAERLPNTSQSAPHRRHRPDAATARGEKGGAAVLVGLPVVTSPRGLRFWLHLCGVGNNPGICDKACEAFRNSPPDATTDPSPGSEQAKTSAYGEAWFEATMSKLKSLDDSGLRVAGVHVMAPGPGPRRRAGELASKGVFGSSRRRGRE